MAMSLNNHHSVGVVLIFLCGLIQAVHSQMDSCGSDLSMFLPATFNTSELRCKPVWKSFILRYNYQSEDDTLNIILSAVYTSGWIGIGFSPDGLMVGSSAMIGWIDSTGKAYIKQYYLKGTAQSEVIVNKGKLMETKVSPRVVLYGVNIYLAFQVKFFESVKDQSVLFAYSTEAPNGFRLSEHEDKISLSFDFSSSSTSSYSPSSYPHKLKKNHGAMAMIGWGVLLPIGAIIARYLRHKDPLWYHLHLAIQFLGYIIGLTAIVAGISLYDKLNSDFRSHKSLGIFILVLGSLQVIAFFIRPDKESKIRKYWNWYHHWLGRLALFVAAINIALGLHIGGASNSWKLVYGILLSGLLIFVSVLEILLWTRWSRKTISPSPSF
ncbi:hypothetical protein LUZ60_009993 [Juncus effusus]|nr:hypothetical protein LUZ60_009993 [Juncus effusus]